MSEVTPSQVPAKAAQPGWQELVTHWPTLTVEQCADVMLDLNPAADRPLEFYEGNEKFHTWYRTIESACELQALGAIKQRSGWGISPEALIAWCERYGYACPLKLPRDQIVLYGEIQRPVEAAVDLDQLRNELERLQVELLAARNRADANGREADRTRARVTELEAQGPQCLNPQHPRYAPRLAAAIRCWEAMEHAESRSIAKEASRWIEAYASEFSLKTSEKLRDRISYLIMSLKNGNGD